MKLKEYVQNLIDLMEDHPEYGEYTAVYAKDDEGNGFQEIWATADEDSIGYFDGEYHGDMSYKSQYDDEPDEWDLELNAIVVN